MIDRNTIDGFPILTLQPSLNNRVMIIKRESAADCSSLLSLELGSLAILRSALHNNSTKIKTV